jgi:hypothetical protein
MPVQLEYKYLGSIKPHFFDEHGNFWVDELGTDDAGEVIPLDVQIGDDTLQQMSMRSMSQLEVDEVKSFHGIKVYGKNAISTKIFVSIDGSPDWIDVGEMTSDICSIKLPNNVPKGTMINTRFVNSSAVDATEIHKAVIYFNIEEDTFRESK